MKEIFKAVLNYEQYYEVSRTGVVRNKKTGYLPKQTVNAYGYHTVYFVLPDKNITKSVHRVVAETYIPNPKNKRTVNHINGIKKDNRVENLEWCSIRENESHAHSLNVKTSKYLGVCWSKNHQRYMAQCKINGKNTYLGVFKDEESAYEAVKTFHAENNIENKYL